MATHSSVLAWRIPGVGSHRVGHDRSALAVAVAKINFSVICQRMQSYFIQVLTANILIWGQLITIMNVENLVCW